MAGTGDWRPGLWHLQPRGGGTTGAGSGADTGGAMGAGGGPAGFDGAVARLIDVAKVEMAWSTGMDAGSGMIQVAVLPDGSATCRESFGGNRVLAGRLDAPDAELTALVAAPGMVDKLVTECPFNVADAGSTIVTTLKTGETFSRLVFGTCSDDGLASLVSALRRIGVACVHRAHPVDAL